MSVIERRSYGLDALLVFVALLCAIAAFIVAEGWSQDFGTWPEWIAASVALRWAADLF